MTKETREDMEQMIRKYEKELNEVPNLPQWRIDDITLYIKRLKGFLNGTN